MKKDTFEEAKKRALAKALETCTAFDIPGTQLDKEYRLGHSTLSRIKKGQSNIISYQFQLDKAVRALIIHRNKLARSNKHELCLEVDEELRIIQAISVGIMED